MVGRNMRELRRFVYEYKWLDATCEHRRAEIVIEESNAVRARLRAREMAAEALGHYKSRVPDEWITLVSSEWI